jgi:hypothetical protein
MDAVEFFANGHIEVQALGRPSLVQTVTLSEISSRIVGDLNRAQ